jgi:hypothetical protein
MIERWNIRRSLRLFLVGSILACGFVLALLLLRQGDFTVATALIAISLAALVGTGKLASP